MSITSESNNVEIKSLSSPDGRYTVKQNPDGLLVITDRDKDNKVIWDSLYSVNYIKNQEPYSGMSTCTPNCTYTLVLQPDGNLVTYSDKKNMFGNDYVWAASSTKFFRLDNHKVGGPYTLKMQTDGNLVLYNKNLVPYWSIMSNYNQNLLYNALIDTNLYIKWEITDIIEFENLSNVNGKISFTVKLDKKNKMFIYDKIFNKLLHITDYIPKGVKSNIKIDYNNNGEIISTIIYDKIIVENENIVITSLTSENGRYTAKQNPDGLLVITDRDKGNKVIWDSLYSVNYIKNQEPYSGMSTCTPNCTYTLVLQPDGNLVTYSDKKNMFGNDYVWAISSSVRLYDNNNRMVGGPYTLIMRDDGNLVLYNKNSTPYWSILSNHNKLYNSLIDTNLYIKWEFTELIEFENFSNENGKISFTVTLNKTNRMFIYDKISNKLLHITDYISKGVKSNIIINKNDLKLSFVNSEVSLPVPEYYKDNKYVYFGTDGGNPFDLSCPEGSIVSGIYTNEYGRGYLTRFSRTCINPYTKIIDQSNIYGLKETVYTGGSNNEGGFKKIRGDYDSMVDNLTFFKSDNNEAFSVGWRNNQNTTWLDCGDNGKIGGFKIMSGNAIDKVGAYCSYPKII